MSPRHMSTHATLGQAAFVDVLTRWTPPDTSGSTRYDVKTAGGWRTLGDDPARRLRAVVPKPTR